ncbi:hypothetical protein SDC9_92155 [bioreactor metagenome]|uniref:Uncharacterized protein n=1 Tax=bioreactor metagenome TaxID=1076179 RepID=A0A644ZYG4_9ZZZZ
MRAAVDRRAYARVPADDLDVQPRVGAGEEDLIEDAAACKRCKRVHERNEPDHAQPRRHGAGVGFHYTQIERAIRETLFEPRRAHGVGKVAVEGNDLLVPLAGVDQRVAVGVPHVLIVKTKLIFHIHARSPLGYVPASSRRSISATASSAISFVITI